MKLFWITFIELFTGFSHLKYPNILVEFMKEKNVNRYKKNSFVYG